MTSSVTAEALAGLVRDGLGESVSVRARRPGGKLFQIEIPAFLPDGDAAQIYLEPRGGTYVVSDIAQTMMRLSYTRDLTDQMREKLAELAESHGFGLTEAGRIEAVVRPDELVGALFGLAQIEAVAEDSIHRVVSRGPRPEEFKAQVIAALQEHFRDQVAINVMPPGETVSEYAVDAVVSLARPVAVQAIPNDIEAERAIGTRYRAKALDVKSWIAVPRELKRLSSRTQERLVDAFIVSGSKFEAQALAQRLEQVAS